MDRRVKYTKKVIKDSFIELLQEKDINKITISELCEKSDINRATFYRYYVDIYDLLDKIEKELIDELKEMLLNNNDYSMKEIIKEYLKVFLENKSLIKIIFSNSKNFYFLNSFIEFFYENCKTKLFDEPNDSEEKTLAAIFGFNGTLGIINYWIQNDFDEDIESLADTIDKISYYGLKKYKNN